MDFGTIRHELENGHKYTESNSPEAFGSDCKLVFQNALLYNAPGLRIHSEAKVLLEFFTEAFSTMKKKLEREASQQRLHSCNVCIGNTCMLCDQKCLELTSPQMICSGGCLNFIKHKSSYYATRDGTRVWCVRCYTREKRLMGNHKNNSNNNTSTSNSLIVDSSPIVIEDEEQEGETPLHRTPIVIEPKLSDVFDTLEKRILKVDVEPWVKCDACLKWVHQICGLFNVVIDSLSNQKSFICPICLLKQKATTATAVPPVVSIPDKPQITTNIHTNALVRSAASIPHTHLSDFLTLFIRKALSDLPDPEATQVLDSLSIRVVSNFEKIQLVPETMRKGIRTCKMNTYPKHIPYMCKTVYIYQQQEGVDICLFAMYLQEYGEQSVLESNRCSFYLSYIDSVQFMRPKRLRSFIYQNMIVGYFDYARRRGFTKGYIWSCPPERSVNYVFWVHPPYQKTPTKEMLCNWYKQVLTMGKEKNIIVNWSTFYEEYFSTKCNNNSSIESGSINNNSTSRKRIPLSELKDLPPCFDGDFWPIEADRAFKKKQTTRNSVSTISIPSPTNDTKDYYDIELNSKIFDQATTSVKNENQNLIVFNLIPPPPLPTTPPPQPSVDLDHRMDHSHFIGNRFSFHQLCSYNGYQFDSHRRAKHSTMMLLHLFFHPELHQSYNFCSQCGYLILSEAFYQCQECKETAYSLCDWCFKTNTHKHDLVLNSDSNSCNRVIVIDE